MPSDAVILHAFHTLLAHLRSIVGRRERSGLDGALLLAARALFRIERGLLLRVVRHKDETLLVPSAETLGDALETRDAYLQTHNRGLALADHPEYQQSCAADQVVRLVEAGRHRHIVPLFRFGLPHALLELDRDQPLSADEIGLLDQLLGLFLDHLNLIDYAETDTLTGLLNRKTFDENLARVLANAGDRGADPAAEADGRHRRGHKATACNWLAVADIDHFKRVNDTWGHIIGDEVLILVAGMMRESFRFDDQLFRFGGEEFVMVLQPTTQDDALAVLERFRRTIEAHEFPIVGHITISLGITRVDALDTPTELVGRADQALYVAKDSGRNRVESYEALHAAGRIAEAAASKPKAELF